ncbi:MAG TPA: ABC transporter permease [Anaerohalosphaeraceae bacterium]|nr:ABC transporter permease [Anaerohalosphaeraceae bacterium]
MAEPSADKSFGTTFSVKRSKTGEVHLELAGSLTYAFVGSLWNPCIHAVRHSNPQKLIIELDKMKDYDSAGIGLLTFLQSLGRKKGYSVEIAHLPTELAALLERYCQTGEKPSAPPAGLGAVASLGKTAAEILADIHSLIAFFAQVLVTGLRYAVHPLRFRWNDFFVMTELAGFRALGIVSLLGFLFGLIIAFSSAMPLRQFGVEIYVADLVAIALARVLGPFITAIIVAGRTGSAYAAEIGTMKINNEIDALEVMNLDPVGFLVLPRVLAAILATPLLTVIANLWGLAGSGLVILSLGYPLSSYLQHVESLLSAADVLVGIVKAVVFGGLVGMVGCLRGLQTQLGAGAVGIATTRAVVTAIILLVITEGIFAVLLHYLGI